AMQRHLAEGFAAAEAATLAARADAQDEELVAPDAGKSLAAALASFDDGGAQAAFDILLGQLSIAQEHFASTLLRGRLLGLARGWGRGIGPVAVLACAPGEQHDLGLLAF